MMRFLRNKFIATFLAFNFIFWIAALYTNTNTLINISNAVFIGSVVAVCWYYGKSAFLHIFRGTFSGAALLITGIVVAYLSQAILRALNIGIRIDPDWDWIRASPLIAYILCISTSGVIMHLFAVTADVEEVTTGNRWALIVAIAVGSFVAGVVLTGLLLSSLMLPIVPLAA